MIINIFYVLGIAGLVFIIGGILIKNKNRKVRDIVYILGGLALLAYSFYINDAIFTVLQVAFTLVAVYDLITQEKDKKRK